jgi:hypothetical protein
MSVSPAASLLPDSSNETVGRPFLSIGITSDVVKEWAAT